MLKWKQLETEKQRTLEKESVWLEMLQMLHARKWLEFGAELSNTLSVGWDRESEKQGNGNKL